MSKFNFIDATPKLARMLAGENLTVLHGNYSTASFDPSNRVLRLPIWEDADKDVYNLLVTHEVGHALYTPREWNHDLKEEIPGCPQIILNIVEDIRIEELVRREYPGTYSMFIRAYQKMLSANRFGIQGIDPNTLGFLNKLNIHAKCGNLVPLNFDEDEQKMVDIAMQIETWEDTLRVTKLLSEFAEKRDQQQGNGNGESQGDEQGEQSEGSGDGQQSEGSGESDSSEGSGDGQEQEDQNSDQKDKNEAPTKKSTARNKPSNDDADNADDSDDESAAASGGGDESEDEQNASGSEGDDSAQDDESEDEQSAAASGEGESNGGEDEDASAQDEQDTASSDRKGSKQMKPAPSHMQSNSDVSTDSHMRQSEEELALGQDTRVLRVTREAAHATVNSNYLSTGDNFAYKRFQRRNKAFVQRMVNQFNVRQHARKSKMVEIAKSGRIDPVKLPEYNINDDIFIRYGIDPQSQNHAICMYLDCSGSMDDYARITFVAREVAIMAEFCRTLKIPFQVYGWTTSGYWGNSTYGRTGTYFSDISNNRMQLWVDSTMSPKKYKAAIGALQEIVEGTRSVDMGGTPLTEAKAAAAIISEEYKRKHDADKLHVIFLTDGYGSGNLNAIDGSSHDYANSIFSIQFDGQKPYIRRYGNGVLDERAVDDHMRKICDNYILIDVGDSNSQGDLFTEEYDYTSDSYSYDSILRINSRLRSWAVEFSGGDHVEGDTSGAVINERSSSQYTAFRKISGILGKMVA